MPFRSYLQDGPASELVLLQSHVGNFCSHGALRIQSLCRSAKPDCYCFIIVYHELSSSHETTNGKIIARCIAKVQEDKDDAKMMQR